MILRLCKVTRKNMILLDLHQLEKIPSVSR
jgi:hypothetical protein